MGSEFWPNVFSRYSSYSPGGYSKRLSYPDAKSRRVVQVGPGETTDLDHARSLHTDQRLSPYQPNEGLFDRDAVLGIVYTKCFPDYDSDSELKGESENRTSSRPHSHHGGRSQFRSPLMENIGLLNCHDSTVSGAFTGGETAPFPQSTMIIAMLQQQQHLLQEVVGTQQGLEEK